MYLYHNGSVMRFLVEATRSHRNSRPKIIKSFLLGQVCDRVYRYNVNIIWQIKNKLQANSISIHIFAYHCRIVTNSMKVKHENCYFRHILTIRNYCAIIQEE